MSSDKQPESKLELSGVKKTFGSNKVLQGIDLAIPKGKSLVVIGGSGTGKSVMLKCVLGLITPDEGSIKVDGKETVSIDAKERDKLMRKFGMLFQGGALFDSMSIWENVAFGLIQGRGMDRKDAKGIALEKIKAVGLREEVAKLYPAELSGGMQKRVSLARAIAANPEIIFFDEPTTGLDPIMADVINELISSTVRQMGATALSITHDMASARKIADEVAMIYQGQIIWRGPVDDLDDSGNEYVEQFIHGRAEGPITDDAKSLRHAAKHPGYIFSFVIFALVLLCGSVYAQTQDARPYTLVTVAEGLDYPWSVAFLPDGDMLVSERPGALVRINAQGEKTQIKGLPPVVARRQGGLLGLALDPEFEHNRLLYFSYVARGMGGTGTQVARAELRDDILHDVRVIFKAVPKMRSDVHFGSRLLFAPDGKLFITLGERFDMRQAQDRSNHLGSLIRINPDGSIPDDNPFVGQEKIRPKIYSYGHRNMQGIALQPGTNTIWAHEHGPKGGDEVNIIKPGANYGWPKITYGIDYDGTIISTETEAPGMEQPVTYWTPSIAPSGMSFYTGDKFPDWQGDLFVGALAGTHLRHLSVNGQQITAQDILLEELGERIRDVATGPDGYLYVLTDSHDGRLIRLEPRHQR